MRLEDKKVLVVGRNDFLRAFKEMLDNNDRGHTYTESIENYKNFDAYDFIIKHLDEINCIQVYKDNAIQLWAGDRQFATLIVLVFLFRLPKINGLRWVGISGLVGAVFVGGLGYLLQAKPVLDSLLPALGEVATLAMPLISTLASTFVTFAIIYSIAGLVLVVGNGVLNAVVTKKAQ